MTILINPLSPEFLQNPYPTFQTLRENAPVYWHEATGYWWLTTYSDVWNALRDQRFSSARGGVLLQGIPESEQETKDCLGRLLESRLLFTDGAQHARLRSLLNHAFSPRQMERIRSIVIASIRELLSELRELKEIDVVREIADPLPSKLICRVIGLPPDRFEDFKTWTSDVYGFLGLASGNRTERARRAASAGREASRFLEDLIAVRRKHPGDDLISDLILAEESGQKLSVVEMINNLIGLLNAGHETTTNLLVNSLYVLLINPQALQAVRLNPELLEGAIEETARLESPVQMPARILQESITLNGINIPAGANILLLLGSANRDEQVFPEPDRLILTRSGSRPVTYGYGPHFCIGAAMARMIAHEFFVGIFREWSSIELIEQPSWRPYPVFRGLESLRVRVDR